VVARTRESIGRQWVVVADEASAVFYARENSKAPLAEFERLDNETGRKRGRELESDRGGRAFDSHGQGRHALGSELHDAKRQAAEAFARRIAERLESGCHSGDCVLYSLVAPPRFLGMLRHALGRTSCPEPRATVAKEATGRDAAFVEALLS